MLNREQIFEYKRLQQVYCRSIADNYARAVTRQNYRNRDPRTSPRTERIKTKKVTFQNGDRVSTEVFKESDSPNGWLNITDSRIVNGVITKINDDLVWIDCNGETVIALIDQCWRAKR